MAVVVRVAFTRKTITALRATITQYVAVSERSRCEKWNNYQAKSIIKTTTTVIIINNDKQYVTTAWPQPVVTGFSFSVCGPLSRAAAPWVLPPHNMRAHLLYTVQSSSSSSPLPLPLSQSSLVPRENETRRTAMAKHRELIKTCYETLSCSLMLRRLWRTLWNLAPCARWIEFFFFLPI